MNVRYRVDLEEGERQQLEALVTGGHRGVRRVKRAQILLSAAAGQTDEARRVPAAVDRGGPLRHARGAGAFGAAGLRIPAERDGERVPRRGRAPAVASCEGDGTPGGGGLRGVDARSRRWSLRPL
jgi:hypothetical protein